MPPRTRMRATKIQKENIEIVKNIKRKTNEKVTRKALADKTNSLSDTDTTNPSTKPQSKLKENPPNLVEKRVNTVPKKQQQTVNDAKTRPRRTCRVKSVKESPTESSDINLFASSPFKSPSKSLESSLVVNRPKRICRLPSKFEDHFVSPNKLIPLNPCNASTPIQKKDCKSVIKDVQNPKTKKSILKRDRNESSERASVKVAQIKSKNNKSGSSIDKSSPDTNNNGAKTRPKRGNVNTKLRTKQISPQTNKFVPFGKRLLNKSLSFRVLEDNKSNENSKNLDIYEFTYDPADEPTPQKKKKKKIVRKKPTKPKTVVLKSNYNDNVAKALESFRTRIKPPQPQVQIIAKTQNTQLVKPSENEQNTSILTKPLETNENIPQNNSIIDITPAMPENESAKTSIHESNYASIRIEDIAADFELIENPVDINYSPVNSPLRPKTPDISKHNISTAQNHDPLNLQGDSFFDDQPVASSSMNVSVRHPQASPWRVDFGSLPIKWQANTYVKSNMTPAVESSFINTEEFSKKKHVYTNMLPDEPLPQIDNNPPALKQTSIISFIKEVAERSLNKKKRKRSVSPMKQSFIFDDIPDLNDGYKTPKKAKKSVTDSTPNKFNENNVSDKSLSPTKADKKKDKNVTYFGFDESEDQENMLPDNVPNTRSKRGLKARAVLQECNVQKGPTRAVMPVEAKAKLPSSEAVEQLYDQLKTAEDASQFPEKEILREPIETSMTNVEDACPRDDDDDDSVHLFEDIELIHHLKPHRKSYTKTKKVALRRHSDSDSDTQDGPRPDPAEGSSDGDDLADLSFHLPNIKEKKPVKKKKKKKLLSKKEEKEVEEWAAGFNSMCEDIDEFSLVVE